MFVGFVSALRTQPVAPWDFPSALIFNLVHSKCMKIICIYIFFSFNAKIFIWIASKHMYLDSTCACYADAGCFAIKNNLLKCILFFQFRLLYFSLVFLLHSFVHLSVRNPSESHIKAKVIKGVGIGWIYHSNRFYFTQLNYFSLAFFFLFLSSIHSFSGFFPSLHKMFYLFVCVHVLLTLFLFHRNGYSILKCSIWWWFTR